MITTIAIRDFQSWHKVDLELGPVTMFVGKGNSGKTAIIRALKYALTNQTGDDFIREGAQSTSVGISIDDRSLVWSKSRGKGARYVLSFDDAEEDAEFTKTGSSVPPEIAQAIGIHEVAIDKTTTLMPNIQMQFDTPFIIGESGSKIARILGRLTKLNILVTAQMACRTDKERARNQQATALEWSVETAARLKDFPDTSELDERRAELASEESCIIEWQRKINYALGLVEKRRQLLARLDAGDPAKLRKKAAALGDEFGRLSVARAKFEAYRSAVVRMADASCASDSASEKLTVLRTEYHQHCQNAGVCATCPWI
jgi:exonuclease SbcC